MSNVIFLKNYFKKKKKKNLTWLYSLSEYELISEFINSHDELENDKNNLAKIEWLDTVSDVVAQKCFEKAETK